MTTFPPGKTAVRLQRPPVPTGVPRDAILAFSRFVSRVVKSVRYSFRGAKWQLPVGARWAVPREPQVVFNWAFSSYFGWGIYGMNLALAWADRTDLHAATSFPIEQQQIRLDPLDMRRIEPAMRRSLAIHEALKPRAGTKTKVSCMVLHPLLNFMEVCASVHGVLLEGTPTVGVAFLEHTHFNDEQKAVLRQYLLVVAGSTWNKQLLEHLGAPRAELVLQGVDTSNFHPAPKRGLFRDRFVVFSGGKLEYRKGQDQVVLAFRAFAQRHPDALLLTAWDSPWPTVARSLAANGALLPPRFQANGKVEAYAWTEANGIAERQTVHCGVVPNYAVPRVLREADVALFPNRAEGGTNLVAMECMACGIPVILSANTGHLDLLEYDAPIPLRRQTPMPGEQNCGWAHSDVDEMVEALEEVYRDRDAARARGLAGAEQIAPLTWNAQMNKMGDLLVPLLPEK
jgi:glycosyltransferase involved in cell wall biosynthesis